MTAPTPARPRTAAASDHWRRRGAQRLALDLSVRIRQLDDEWLSRLARNVLDECERRGVAPWTDDEPVETAPVAVPAWGEAT